MKIEKSQVEILRIVDAQALDPISVIVQDYGAGQGKILIECYGTAWSGFWGAMGNATVRQFFMSAGSDYLAGALCRPTEKRKDHVYLRRIIEAVQEAFRGDVPPAESA